MSEIDTIQFHALPKRTYSGSGPASASAGGRCEVGDQDEGMQTESEGCVWGEGAKGTVLCRHPYAPIHVIGW